MCQNFSAISSHAYKICIIQRIHSKLWLTTQRINKYLTAQITTSLSITLLILLDHGLVFVSKLAAYSSNWTQVPITFTPLHNFLFLGFSCFQCCEASKYLRSLLLRSSDLTQIQGPKLIEVFSQQVEMQKIEFEPRKFLLFNLAFFLDVVRFVVDYDIVFMQFYFG